MKELKYTMKRKEPFNMIGYMDTFTYVDGNENYECITQKWADLFEEKMQKLFPLMNGFVQSFIGVSSHIDDTHFRYTIAVSTDVADSKEFHITKIPEMNWLILPCIGAISSNQENGSFGINSSAMVILKNHVLGGWLDENNFVQADYPRIEIYPQGDMTSKDYVSELWIPIE
ncbi:GyrI-like domain-containing protein [Listeria seeligeri]|uniref:GyrI-like domain-containing protein n=1 Tax=Listeria seeligeri TaxID=1640 RepID=UPI0022EBE9DD|nr:GyrI-like domain-containing protein [Listeria seeligeri]